MKVLVTGGSRGIGFAIANLFTINKHDVYAPNRQELDLSLPINLQYRDFDIIINCAGINPIKLIVDADNNDVMQVNYLAPFEIIQQCLPHMIKNQYGRIINIGSIWIDMAKPGRSIYSASKSALHSLTKSLTAEYAKHNILTNTISPGYIETDLTYKNNSVNELNLIKSKIPIGRLGNPNEVAKLVYQLTIDNTLITGQNINIDGGFLCAIV